MARLEVSCQSALQDYYNNNSTVTVNSILSFVFREGKSHTWLLKYEFSFSM